jgi:hypothetical protein
MIGVPEREPPAQSTGGAAPCRAAPPPTSHDKLRLGLMDAGRRVRAAAEDPRRFPAARDNLARFCFAELLPHLEADESWLVEARHCGEGHLLADAMRTEARAMTAAVDELASATGPYEVVAVTRLLHTLLAAHAHHEQLLVAAGWQPTGAEHEP